MTVERGQVARVDSIWDFLSFPFRPLLPLDGGRRRSLGRETARKLAVAWGHQSASARSISSRLDFDQRQSEFGKKPPEREGQGRYSKVDRVCESSFLLVL